MSTIFNVFNNTNEHKRFLTGEHLKETKLLGQTGGAIVKKVEQCKPKGLSLRSKSDLNIPPNNYSTPLKKDNSNNFFSKNEFPKKQLLEIPEEFSKTESSELNKEKISEEIIFKELMEKMNRTTLPESEVLATCYDPQQELADMCNKSFEDEFFEYMLDVQDDMDEGFGSEPEELSYPEIPKLQQSPYFSDYEYENHGSPGLPEISDDETF